MDSALELVRSTRNELISSSAISFGCEVLPLSSESRRPLRSNLEDNHCLRLSSSLKDFTVNILDDIRDANAAICISKLRAIQSTYSMLGTRCTSDMVILLLSAGLIAAKII